MEAEVVDAEAEGRSGWARPPLPAHTQTLCSGVCALRPVCMHCSNSHGGDREEAPMAGGGKGNQHEHRPPWRGNEPNADAREARTGEPKCCREAGTGGTRARGSGRRARTRACARANAVTHARTRVE